MHTGTKVVQSFSSCQHNWTDSSTDRVNFEEDLAWTGQGLKRQAWEPHTTRRKHTRVLVRVGWVRFAILTTLPRLVQKVSRLS